MSQLNVTKSENGLEIAYTYGIRSQGSENTGPLEQEYTVTPSPQVIQGLCAKIDDTVLRAHDGADTGDELADNGKLLYKTLFPSGHVNIPDLARRVHGEDPLLICSNEAQVPWELLHDGDDFLSLKHDLGRKTFVSVQVASGRAIGPLKRALIVSDPLGDLAAAREEATNITSWLRGHGTECTSLTGAEASLVGLVQALDEREYDLFHYSGHVDTPYGTKYTGLRLHEDQLLDERALQPLSNKGVPPIVFINGCASAGQMSNLCIAFMITGAKVVMGTRYKIREESARQFAENFYTMMLAGNSAGSAVRAARRSLAKTGSIDWASFVLYGDPSAVIGSSAPPPDTARSDKSGKVGPHQTEGDLDLDSQASALMQRLMRQAAPHGMATSLDLLTELIQTREFRRRAGGGTAANLSVLQQLLSAVQDATPPVPMPDKESVELSGTVNSVLVRAQRRVQESGRELIAIDDLVEAFFAVGGGYSRELLELIGLPLSDRPAGQCAVQKLANGTRHVDDSRALGLDGLMHSDSVNSAAARALQVAVLLAAERRSVVGTNLLMTAFAVAGSTALWNALADQGPAGEAAFARLSSPAKISGRHFSPRTLDALRRAVGRAAGEPLDDAAILRELLADPNSTARELLSRQNIDPGQVLRFLAP
jgi:hypothetical protein